MKTVFIFPGLNGLIKLEDRFRYIQLPEVQQRLHQVEQIFKLQDNEDVSFEKYLQGSVQEIYSVENISKAATAICALQVGAAENLMKTKGIIPDWTLGCSLGDLARGVISDVCTFEFMISGYIRFAHKLKGVETIGANIGVSKPKGAVFTQDEIATMGQLGLDVSVMTPKFLNIGGRYSDLEKLQEAAKEKRWRVVKILDYPAHSRYIGDYVAAAAHEVREVQLNLPKYRTFSSITCRELTKTDELKQELMLNMTQPLRWGEAIKTLETQLQDVKFINIGPCKSLTKMIPDLDLVSPVYEIENL
ncbi:ACP S-malonyltransferase [Bdellovibrio sp. qaytius]|nr:ACP S-malonyltransferase [Bdellovibrio sp. qaytius]